MKNCAFQYATDDGLVLQDTGLIDMDEAEMLWNHYLPTFKGHLEDGRGPEMAIWIDMSSDCDYHTTAKHYCADDFRIIDGELCEVIKV